MQMSEVRAQADARALRMIKEWRGGSSYNVLAKRHNLSRTRVRQIIHRAKMLEAGKHASRSETR